MIDIRTSLKHGNALMKLSLAFVFMLAGMSLRLRRSSADLPWA